MEPPRIEFFSESGSDRPQIRIRSGKSGSIKKRSKTVNMYQVDISYLALSTESTLNTVLFGQVPLKPQKHHLDPIS